MISFKRLLSIFLVLILPVFFTSCKNNDTDNDTLNDTNSSISIKAPAKTAVAEWQEDDTLKILSIGNSFSINTLKYVYEIATAAGAKQVYLGNLYMDGCKLETHAKNARNDAASYRYYTNSGSGWTFVENHKMSDALKEQDWDIITMQQASSPSGRPETYGDLEYLVDYVKNTANKSATLVWNATWAYQSDYSGIKDYASKQSYMYSRILYAIEKKVKPIPEFKSIIPCGTAIQNARTSFMGDRLTKDGYHLNTLGEYIAGLTLTYHLTGLPIEDISFVPAGINEKQKLLAIESAVNASNTPEKTTQSQFTES